MTDSVRDDDLLGRLRLADPVDPAELERTAAPLRERIKARAIAAGNSPSEPIPAGDRVAVEAGAPGRGGFDDRGRSSRAGAPGRGGRRGRASASGHRRRWLPLGFASFGAAAVLAAIIVFGGGSGAPGTRPAFADAAVKVAEANPRLLITAPGWKITEARSFKPQDGQMMLGDGSDEVHLAWIPAMDRRADARPDPRETGRWTETIAGREAIVSRLRVAGLGTYFTTTFPVEGGIFVVMDGAFAKRSEWEALMRSVRALGVDEWLEAMPGAILRPGEFSAEVARMLRGVPVPAGFDAHAALSPIQLTNRFQAAKKLTQAVSCEWVRSWEAARAEGDAAGAHEAAAALSDAADWPVLLRMVREKGYTGDTLPAPGYGWPTSIITVGRQMESGRLERERAGVGFGDKVIAEGFSVPKGAYPPDKINCFPPPPAKAAP
jgi:hypothetical protein